MLIMALDYKRTRSPLTCSVDGRNMEKCLEKCRVHKENIIALYDKDPKKCTKSHAIDSFKKLAKKPKDGDTFIWYYSGHGVNVKDVTGDEKDGQDEAFCFVTPQGQVTSDSLLIDDDWAALVTKSPVSMTVECDDIVVDCSHARRSGIRIVGGRRCLRCA